MTTVGEQIRKARNQKGLTQEQLADKVDRNLRTIQRIENSESAPRNKTISLICEVLEIKLEEELDKTSTTKINLQKIANLIIQGLFLFLLNCTLVLLAGYLTINQEANKPTRVAAHLLSFFVPFFIVLLTKKMNGIERMLKFGIGYIAYLIVATYLHDFSRLFIKGFYTTQAISLVVLFYGMEIVRLLNLNKEE